MRPVILAVPQGQVAQVQRVPPTARWQVALASDLDTPRVVAPMASLLIGGMDYDRMSLREWNASSDGETNVRIGESVVDLCR